MDQIFILQIHFYFMFLKDIFIMQVLQVSNPSCSDVCALTTGPSRSIPSPTSVRSVAPALSPLVPSEKPESCSQSPLVTRAEMTSSSFANLKNSDTVKAVTWLLANHVSMKGTCRRRDMQLSVRRGIPAFT